MTPLRFIATLFFTLVAVEVGRTASAFEERITDLFRPLQAEQVAMSPDGEYIAYTRHERGELAIYIMAVSRTERKFQIRVEADRTVAFSKGKAPPALRFLRWATPERLIFAPTPHNIGVVTIAPIYAVNRDGTDPKKLADATDFSLLMSGATEESAPTVRKRNTTILGFQAGNRQALLVEAQGVRTPPAADPIPTTLFSLNLKTGKLSDLVEETDVGRYFYDQKGQPRLVYSHPYLSRTRTFRYNTGGKWGSWRNADETWAGPVAKTFPVTVDNYYGERAFPIGFAADPKLLYYASNIGRDTYGVYALDLAAKQKTEFALEDAHVDLVPLEAGETKASLIFDELSGELAGIRAVGLTPFNRWLDPEIARVQADVDRKFPQRAVEILQWDDARQRFLLRVTGGVEPGRYYVHQRTENVLVEVLRRAPWLRNADLHSGTSFAFDTANGIHLTGHLTFPRKPRLKPTPLLIDFSTGVLGEPLPGFNPESQALAEMGFIVARINFRGGSGFGVKHRQAIHGGIDRVPVDDALAVIEWIGRHHAVDRKRIAALGHGLGGYLALRALQLAPESFRCAVAIEAPLDPTRWLEPPLDDLGSLLDQGVGQSNVFDRAPRPPPPRAINFLKEAQRTFVRQSKQKASELSVLRQAERLTKPVMLVVDNAGNLNLDEDESDDSSGGISIAGQNADLRTRLKRLGRTVEYVTVGSGYAQNVPAAKAKVLRQIEEFFNLNLYDFKVEIGPTTEVK